MAPSFFATSHSPTAPGVCAGAGGAAASRASRAKPRTDRRMVVPPGSAAELMYKTAAPWKRLHRCQAKACGGNDMLELSGVFASRPDRTRPRYRRLLAEIGAAFSPPAPMPDPRE